MLGTWQIVIIVAVVVLLFGSKKLPELAKALRLSVDEFKKDDKGSKQVDDSKKED